MMWGCYVAVRRFSPDRRVSPAASLAFHVGFTSIGDVSLFALGLFGAYRQQHDDAPQRAGKVLSHWSTHVGGQMLYRQAR